MDLFSYLRGLKLKLTIILLIGTLALIVMYSLTQRLVTEAKTTIESISKERLPKTAMFGDATTELARFQALAYESILQETSARSASLERADQSFKKLQGIVAEIKKFKLSERSQSALSESLSQLKLVEPDVAEFLSLLKESKNETDAKAKDLFFKKITLGLGSVSTLFAELRKRQDDKLATDRVEALAQSEAADHMALSITILSLIFFWIMGQGLSFFIVKKLSLVNVKVDASAKDVSIASEDLAQSSQQLSSSSQEQASALEEASASLQEIAGMVESTVKNTEDSLSFAKNVKDISTETNTSILLLSESMKEIQLSNQKVEALSRLIEEIGEKTELIDEIVFQTKLLSFNASVEAERAGEYGRGFAVVAQEVGNLAALSGKSAIEIASIVKTAMLQSREVTQDNRERVQKGAELCTQSVTKMKTVTSATDKILESCELVLRASKEQSTGIRQVSTAVESLNRATQGNAGNAEKSASASKNLAELSTDLEAHVSDLQFIIHGLRELKPVETLQKKNIVAFKAKAPVQRLNAQPNKFKKVAGESPKNSGSTPGGWDQL